MSQRTLEAHYLPNWRLTQAHGLSGYNCGYAVQRGGASFHEHQQALVWRLIGEMAIGPKSTVVDVGCGIGGPAGWITERYQPRRLIGVEYLWSSVAAAHARAAAEADRDRPASRPIFVQGDAHRLPLADGSVDVIFNLESALHYPDKRTFISECRRILAPGGALCLGDITTSHRWLFTPAQLLNRLPSQYNSNVWLWSPKDYRRAFDAEGLELIRHEEASRPVADSLADGIAEIRHRGPASMKGFRGRFFYLAFLEKLLRARLLRYDLFCLRRSR
ncbi:MAG TPA: methyltransferase domain-containing protein [Phycisphaerae bacterium]|nr:methyltransferase domain-containing protein [Phycisphaerae bacterium]